MSVPKRRPPVVLTDLTSLDDDEKSALRAKARAAVDAEVKAKTQEALYEEYLIEERKARDPKQEMKYIVLDMAGHSDRIMLDGTVFFHGVRYAVPRPVYEVLRETVQRGWTHEREIKFANSNEYRKKAAPVLSDPSHMPGGM